MTASESLDQGSILAQYPRRPRFTVSQELSITGTTAEKLWAAYRADFEPLASLALLPHLYERDEILDELANPRITKIVGWHGDEPVGLAMVTNSLDDVPQISPAFLRATYPEHAERNSIFFGILVVVSRDVRSRAWTMFSRLYTEAWQVVAKSNGVLVFDICDYNRETFHTDVLTQRIAQAFPHASVDVLERSTWHVVEFPENDSSPDDTEPAST